MKFLEKLKANTHILLLGVCVFLFLNLMSTCSVNRRTIELSNKVDTLEKTLIDKQETTFEYQSLEIDRKLSENLIEQKMLFDKKLEIDSVKKRLNNTLLEMNKIKNYK